MINKLKIILLIAVLSAAGIVVVGHSAYAIDHPVTYANDTTVILNNRYYTILAGSTATSVVVNANTLVVTDVPSDGYFTLTSANGDTLGSGGANTYPETCNGHIGSVVVPALGATTFTPTSVLVCASGGGGGVVASSYSGGGGGGGGGYVAPTTTTVTTTTTTVGCLRWK